MAFVNAYLTEEEKKKFEESKVRDPRYKISKINLIPSEWTVDKENKMALIDCGIADRDEYWKQTFAFIYKQIDNDHLIKLTLIDGLPDGITEKQLRKQYNVNLVKKWKVYDFKIPEVLRSDLSDKKLFEILEEALTAYGINGNPEKTYSIKALLQIEDRRK